VAEKSLNLDHCIQFNDTIMVAKKSGHMDVSLGKWLRLSSILTTWTKVCPWAGHRSLSFKPWRNKTRFSLRTS